MADIRTELKPGERVVWSGHPDPMVTLRRMRFLLFIAVPWLLAAFLFAPGGTLGLFLTLPGFGLLLGPAVGAWQAHRTMYMLTDRRALVLSKFARNRTFSGIDLGDDENEVEILSIAGDSGAVLFRPNVPRRFRHTDHTGKFGFWDIAGTQELAGIVRRTLRKRAGTHRTAESSEGDVAPV